MSNPPISHGAAPKENSRYLAAIVLLSIAVPIAVAVLILGPQGGRFGKVDVHYLASVNAILNSLTACALLLGYVFIRTRNVAAHRAAMLTAFFLSTCFLIFYVVYHAFTQHTVYGGEGILRPIYFFVLISHILLAFAIVPLVLTSLYFAFTEQFTRHKKLARWTFPIWMYVAITGVIVYLMIAPYYPWNRMGGH